MLSSQKGLYLGKFWDIYDIYSAISPIGDPLGEACLNLSATACRKTNLKYNILFHYIVSASVESYKHKWKLGRMGNAVETCVTDNNNCFHSFSTSHKLS